MYFYINYQPNLSSYLALVTAVLYLQATQKCRHKYLIYAQDTIKELSSLKQVDIPPQEMPHIVYIVIS